MYSRPTDPLMVFKDMSAGRLCTFLLPGLQPSLPITTSESQYFSKYQ